MILCNRIETSASQTLYIIQTRFNREGYDSDISYDHRGDLVTFFIPIVNYTNKK